MKITDTKLLNKAIESIQNRGKKLDADIQAAAFSVVCHVAEHGDITLANKLYLAMPKGSRRAALSGYLLAYGKLQANTDSATKAESPFLYNRAKVWSADVEAEAQSTQWYDCAAPEKAPDQVFDLTKRLESLLKAVATAQAKGQTIQGLDKLDAIKALIPTAAK